VTVSARGGQVVAYFSLNNPAPSAADYWKRVVVPSTSIHQKVSLTGGQQFVYVGLETSEFTRSAIPEPQVTVSWSVIDTSVDSEGPDRGATLSTNQIIAISVGVLLFTVIVVFGLYRLLDHLRNRRNQKSGNVFELTQFAVLPVPVPTPSTSLEVSLPVLGRLAVLTAGGTATNVVAIEDILDIERSPEPVSASAASALVAEVPVEQIDCPATGPPIPRPVLGILVQDTSSGIRVSDVPSHLADCGLQAGDVIQSIQGLPVKTRQDLRSVVTSYAIGDILHIRAMRNAMDTVEVEWVVQSSGSAQ
jgi:hypothetical protein